MPYGKDDARSALPTATAAAVPEEMAGAEYARFTESEPDRRHLGARIWWGRGQNLVLGYGEVDRRAVLEFDEREGPMLTPPHGGIQHRKRAMWGREGCVAVS